MSDLTTQFIYHRMPSPMRGKVLYPLNELKRIYPDVYDIHVKKYSFRMELMECIIPRLKCRWNDVLHFSPIHPQRVLDKLREVKSEIGPTKSVIIKIPINEINGLPGVIFRARTNSSDYDELFKSCEIRDIIPSEYKELEAVPQQTIDFWHEAKRKGEPMLWYHLVPHFLIKSQLDISNFETEELL